MAAGTGDASSQAAQDNVQYPFSRIKLSKRDIFQSPGFHLPFGLVEWIGPVPKEIQVDSSLAWTGISVRGARLHLLPFGGCL